MKVVARWPSFEFDTVRELPLSTQGARSYESDLDLLVVMDAPMKETIQSFAINHQQDVIKEGKL